MSNFASILTKYGFNIKEQQLDFVRLLFLSGSLDPDRLQIDLEMTGHTPDQVSASIRVSTEACNNQFQSKNLSQFNAEQVLNNLFFSSYQLQGKGNWAENLHNWLIKVTQRDFFARKPGQELWQQETGQWLITYEKEVHELSNRLGLGNEVRPSKLQYQGIAVFGATYPQMEKRLLYTKQLVEQNNIITPQIFLLCGERPADTQVDGGLEYLQIVASKHKVSVQNVTETHLMIEAYQNVKGQDLFAKLPFVVIDTPKGSKPRPTTVCSLVELAKQQPKLAGNVLFISTAPFIHAQKEDTLLTLNECLPAVNAEIVGAGAGSGFTLQRIMGALGGSLFGGYVRVAKELGCNYSRQLLESKRDILRFMAPVPQSLSPIVKPQLTP